MTKKFINAPVAEFLDNYASSGIVRAHMPGHKGYGEEMYSLDITEVKGADSLFEADGIIAQSERNAADIFTSYKTLFSAGGSTLCIQTMIAMCMNVSGSKRIVAARNCHRAFLSVCAFMGADISWVFPEYVDTIVSGIISPEKIEKALTEGEKPACVYITSPDYLGKCADIEAIAEVCHRHGVFLAVDNAHGAYLRFIYDDEGKCQHPLFLGADICCDSAHKTLPVLTGGAYLHINDPALEKYEGFAKEIMSMFGSSSPSYLILRSLDMCNVFMNERAENYFSEMKAASEKVKKELSCAWQTEDSECGKLVIAANPAGLYGYELAEQLREKGIECEYADSTHTVMMLTGLTPDDIYKIGQAMSEIRQPRIRIMPPVCEEFPIPEKAVDIRTAMLSPCECINVDDAEGRICSRAVSCCPPGIAVVAGGEYISRKEIEVMKKYGIERVNVLAEKSVYDIGEAVKRLDF